MNKNFKPASTNSEDDFIDEIELVSHSGAVTFLDVLGWKGIWQREYDAIKNQGKLVNRAQSLAESLNVIAARVNNNDPNKTTVTSVSDTIVIFTPGTPNEALETHAAICRKIIPHSIHLKIPVRGATSYGQFSIKDNIMLGQAIDEAASWHELANWIGVSMTPSAWLMTEEKAPRGWMEYDVPFKTGALKTASVMWAFPIKNDQKTIYEVFYELGPMLPEIAPKYINTLKYLDAVADEIRKHPPNHW